MKKVRNKSVSFKAPIQKYLTVLGITLVTAFVLSISAVSRAVGNAVGVDSEMIKAVSHNILAFCMAFILLILGSVTSAVPFVGILLTLAGVIVLIFESVKIYNQYFADGDGDKIDL